MNVFPETPATLLARLAAHVTGQADESSWMRLFELYEPAIRSSQAMCLISATLTCSGTRK